MSDVLTSLGILATAIALDALRRRIGGFRTVAAFLATLALTTTAGLPAMASVDVAALGAQSEVLEPGQADLEEDLKLTPTKAQYSGIEYAKGEERGDAMSDGDIRRQIVDDVTDSITINVASGSVILSGTVKSHAEARNIIEMVKSIPGVHEITFEFGLEEQASS